MPIRRTSFAALEAYIEVYLLQDSQNTVNTLLSHSAMNIFKVFRSQHSIADMSVIDFEVDSALSEHIGYRRYEVMNIAIVVDL